jgi:putative ABC transport system permease protein
MIRHYLKIALRSLLKQKMLAFINVSGLSVGIACFMLLLLYAVNEFSFDRFHKNEKEIYRVYEWTKATDGSEEGSVSMAMPLGPALKKDFPDAKDYLRFKQPMNESPVRISSNDVRNVQMSFADPQFFSFFSFPLKYGNPKTALKNLNDLVLTEAKAKELFGNDNVIGKTIQIKVIDSFQPFIISAVAKDIPPNSSMRFQAMASFSFLQATEFGKQFNNWYTTAFRTYVQLQPGSTLPNDSKRLSSFHDTYNPDQVAHANQNKPLITYGLQPLHSIHTDTRLNDPEGVATVDPKTIWIIFCIAAGVLFIACINFTTLAIGRSITRSTEVGIRKVIGAARKQLIFQFLAESLLLSAFSSLIGLLVARLLLPYFDRIAGRDMQFSVALYPQMGWFLLILIPLVAVLSGSYPALLLSNFKPVEVLKNKIRLGGSNFFTKFLVTLQFALSIGLIISSIIILQQTKYMTSRDPGFNKENVIIIDAEQANTRKIYPVFKRELTTHSAIAGITEAETGLGEGTDFGTHGFKYNGIHKNIYEYSIDPDYISVLGMHLVAGRNFDRAISDDTLHSVIVNEAMLNDFGWTLKNVIGQQIKGYTNTQTPVIIGVLKDFNFQSLKEKVQPHLFHQFAGHNPREFFIRIKPGNPAPVLASIKSTWDHLVPDVPFKYSFLDENLDDFYKAEQRWSSIIGCASGVSIFLACLGLFGLAALSAIKRTKEIGIRKVFGASAFNVVNIISKDFLKLIMIALFIAVPLAWYFMNKWLEDYAYRINIQLWVFMATGLAVLAISLITISFHAIKAALTNPVNSLRAE